MNERNLINLIGKLVLNILYANKKKNSNVYNKYIHENYSIKFSYIRTAFLIKFRSTVQFHFQIRNEQMKTNDTEIPKLKKSTKKKKNLGSHRSSKYETKAQRREWKVRNNRRGKMKRWKMGKRLGEKPGEDRSLKCCYYYERGPSVLQ